MIFGVFIENQHCFVQFKQIEYEHLLDFFVINYVHFEIYKLKK